MAENNSIPIQPVDKPIICNPYDEPTDHWLYDKNTGKASHAGFRRDAGYYYKTEKSGGMQRRLLEDEDHDDLPLVNLLRKDVKRWRESKPEPYRGASKVTKELLRHWARTDRAHRLFFCQREAVETFIYLAEIRIPGRSSRTQFQKFELPEEDLAKLLEGEKPGFPVSSTEFFPTLIDRPADADLLPLRRLGCKMATGSGKTVVMAMLISWAFCNRGVNRDSTEYPNAVLVACPNLTVKERLQVLRPDNPENYYALFDLVPTTYRPLLQTGKVLIENWHRFAPESEHKEGDKSYVVVDKGPETPETLARRVLGDLYDRMPIMVLNDEGHHCWRPAPAKEDLTKEEKQELEQQLEHEDEARVWLSGLDMINNCGRTGAGKPAISYCVDLSATPFYINGSGHPQGRPFPWLISDFGLVDAIESGIVKIPRLPVKDDKAGKDEAGRPDPKYFRLWRNITTALKPSQKLQAGRPKADVVYREAHGALIQIASQWKERFELIQGASPLQEHIPPVLIVVCDNTDIANEFYTHISGEKEVEEIKPEDVENGEEDDNEGKTDSRKKKKKTVYGTGEIFPEYLSNTPDHKYTVRIDSKLLAEAESDDPLKNKQKAAEELRKVVSTVGKKGQPGEFVRCVVSVSMLTEGWDANNVTHVLGVRAFESQLLCEQVVGRGLRRMNYDPDPETGLLTEEYVDVYGIPFSVIPFKGRPVDKPAPEDKPRNHVWALPDRADMEIRFPVVEGYHFNLKKNVVKCDVDKVEPVEISPKLEPTTTFLAPTMGYVDTETRDVSAAFYSQDRQAYYEQTHFQAILFQITQLLIDDLTSSSKVGQPKLRLQSRHQLFPQVYRIVKAFAERRIKFNGVDRRELGLKKYVDVTVERLRDAIVPDEDGGETPLIPILNRYKPWLSTSGVDFFTTCTVYPTTKSQINAVVQHSTWERQAAEAIEDLANKNIVKCYAKNERLDLKIPYEFMGVEHTYEPDLLVRLTNDLIVIVEIKGWLRDDPNQRNQKHNAARKWVTAVNNLGDFGRWDFIVFDDLGTLAKELAKELGKRASQPAGVKLAATQSP